MTWLLAHVPCDGPLETKVGPHRPLTNIGVSIPTAPKQPAQQGENEEEEEQHYRTRL
jgi:hypothetical protein